MILVLKNYCLADKNLITSRNTFIFFDRNNLKHVLILLLSENLCSDDFRIFYDTCVNSLFFFFGMHKDISRLSTLR